MTLPSTGFAKRLEPRTDALLFGYIEIEIPIRNGRMTGDAVLS